MKEKIALAALNVAQAAFSSAWRPVMDALDDESEETEKLRKLMHDTERTFAVVATALRRRG